jgi:hypothetical protein
MFHVGDTVRVLSPLEGLDLGPGSIGTIVDIRDSTRECEVKIWGGMGAFLAIVVLPNDDLELLNPDGLV